MMSLQDKRVLLTGAGGGIGAALAAHLAKQGAKLGLVGRNTSKLNELQSAIDSTGSTATVITADLNEAGQCSAVARAMQLAYGGVDILINNAGTMQFTGFAEQDEQAICNTINTNLLAPMLLTRAVLPDMLHNGNGQIVNIGSTFGSIGFAWFASYSASKFGLRGFSEALRRELADDGIKVSYIAPRAVKTSLNSGAVYKMAERVKMNMDDPEDIATRILAAITKEKKEVYLGFPESFFARLNGILPRRVDAALRQQNAVMREYVNT